MAANGINAQGFGLRFLFAVLLVFSSYNPEGVSYFHWLKQGLSGMLPLKAFVGVVLLVGWTVYLRATLRALGPFGLFLALAFFGTLLWMVVDLKLVPADSVRAISYLVEVVLCGVLAVGVSWSHLRRRISGQADVDEVEH